MRTLTNSYNPTKLHLEAMPIGTATWPTEAVIGAIEVVNFFRLAYYTVRSSSRSVFFFNLISMSICACIDFL